MSGGKWSRTFSTCKEVCHVEKVLADFLVDSDTQWDSLAQQTIFLQGKRLLVHRFRHGVPWLITVSR